MKGIVKRVIELEDDCKDFNYTFYLLFINCSDLPYLTRGAGKTPLYFQSQKQFKEFKRIADHFTPEQGKSTVVFPVHYSGDPEPLPARRQVITSWSLDLSEITTESA